METNWEQVRISAAIAAMQGMLVSASYTIANREEIIAKLAVEQADTLVKELQKKGK